MFFCITCTFNYFHLVRLFFFLYNMAINRQLLIFQPLAFLTVLGLSFLVSVLYSCNTFLHAKKCNWFVGQTCASQITKTFFHYKIRLGCSWNTKNLPRQTNKSGTHCKIILDSDVYKIKAFFVVCLAFLFPQYVQNHWELKERQLFLATEILRGRTLFLLDFFLEQLILHSPTAGMGNSVMEDQTQAWFCIQPGRNSFTNGSGTPDKSVTYQ